MAENIDNICEKPEEHYNLHACQLQYKERNPEIDKMFDAPRYACANCGVRVHDAKNLCRPKQI